MTDIYDPVYFQVYFLNQVPHAKQREVLRSKKKHKLVCSGRRSGKTQMIAGELIRGSVSGEFKKQFVVAPIYKQSNIVFNKIQELIDRNPKVRRFVKKITQSPSPMIEFVTKDGESATINFGSADSPNTLRGEGYDRMFRDESAFIIKENVEMALRPLIYDTGGPVWETTTPWGKNAFWERWMKAKADTDGDTGIFRYNYLDNPYLSAEGVKEIEKDIEEYGEDDIFVQTEIYGNFVEDVDLYFNLELIDSCISEHTMINVELYN